MDRKTLLGERVKCRITETVDKFWSEFNATQKGVKAMPGGLIGFLIREGRIKRKAKGTGSARGFGPKKNC